MTAQQFTASTPVLATDTRLLRACEHWRRCKELQDSHFHLATKAGELKCSATRQSTHCNFLINAGTHKRTCKSRRTMFKGSNNTPITPQPPMVCWQCAAAAIYTASTTITGQPHIHHPHPKQHVSHQSHGLMAAEAAFFNKTPWHMALGAATQPAPRRGAEFATKSTH